uniref:Venom hemolysin-like protein 8 n=1 Tax=Pristhesancus plagipennis TaxID=1955184 RepID=A0A2K8JNW1_PRIPG|nr:venom hemolysin-like protein 8 [Pristhesancus plagipennis]
MKLLISVLFVVVAIVQHGVQAAPKPFFSSIISGGANFIKNQVEKGTDAFGKAMTLGNDVAQLGSNLASKASFMGSSIGKIGLSSLTTLGDQALNEGVDVAGKGLDFLKTVTGNIPILGTKVQIGADLGKLGLNLGHAAGKNVLDMVNSVGTGSLSAVNTAAQITTGGVGNVAGLGFGLSKKGAEAGANIITSTIDKGVNSLLGKPATAVN